MDGAPACPFVAFDDDRDGRSGAPDHAHRCFAEIHPAPRALAHQEAYCLSSAFPVCPAFQDWARREAAAARTGRASAAAPEPGTGPMPSSAPAMPGPELDPDPVIAPEPASNAAPARPPMPPAGPPARHGFGGGAEPPLPPRRNPPRDWAAPPPWLEEEWPGDRGGRANPYPVEGRGLAGSVADRLLGGDPDLPAPSRRPGHAADDLDDDWAGPGAAAVASAGRPARGGPPSGRPGRPSSQDRDDEDPDDDGLDADGPVSLPRSARRQPARVQPRSSRPGRHDERRDRDQEAADLFGPAWEAPRRFDAYPMLRTRIGLPSFGGVPRVAVAALALVLASAFLFFVGPMLLGFDGPDQRKASLTPAPEVTERPTPSLAPTPPPAPTPQIYVVAKGDTMGRIAKKFGVTIEAILKANPQIKNADRIKIGDQITIPVPETVVDGGDGTVTSAPEVPSATP